MPRINAANHAGRTVTFWFSTVNNMWLTFTLLVLAGIVTADYDHGWTPGTEYTYLVRSRTFASMSEITDQYTGIILKAVLTVQAKHSNSLTAKVSNCEYARVQEVFLDGWDQQISDKKLEYHELPMSGKPFEIVLKHGVIRDIAVERDTPTWEVNMLKSIVGQLQVDTQGENLMNRNEIQVPTDESPYASFRAMEDSVGGKCEVLYDITPLSEHVQHTQPELMPLSKTRRPGTSYIDITKTKNFKKCDQRMDYHFGMGGDTKWDAGSNDDGSFLLKSATSRIVVSGDLKNFTIESAVTTSKMHISPRFFDQQDGIVASNMNLTLVQVYHISSPMPNPRNPESTGNLVYIYNNPFSDMEERKVDQRWNQARTPDSVSSISSSEELAAKKGHNPRVASSSSSSSSSSISSSEENAFWLPRPTLEDPPQNPLLPNFIGYQGKHIGKSNDVVMASQDLVTQISNEMEDPSSISSQQTLEKFTILCSLIRTMNKQQIMQMSSNIPVHTYLEKSNSMEQTMMQNSWSVLRDAVTQAGTGPALLVIKEWIENENVRSGLDLAPILLRIPKTARAPTADYVKTYFELVTSSAVKDKDLLYPSAINAFAELVALSRVNSKSIHNRYPVHTFGRLASKHDKSAENVYIPYLADELSKAVKEKDNVGIQTHITALGTIGHPKILAVFEPYLEGKEQLSVFQRTLMVAALGNLAEHAPTLARSVLYRIYVNTMEPHETRCTAVFLLMKTNPPLTMLQRMAEFTNSDTNKHVNSAVQSTLKSLASITSPEYEELAKKCRAAVALLSKEEHSYQFSHGYFSDTVDNTKNIVYQMIMNYIGSDDSLIPKAMYVGLFSSYGNFKTPPNELLVMFSSVSPLFDLFDKYPMYKNHVKPAAEKIAEQLNIVPAESAPFEMSVLWNSKFMTSFFPMDIELLRHVFNTIPTLEEQPRKLNLHNFASYDVTLGFPTETGLPFVYSFKVPVFRSIKSTNSKVPSGIRTEIRPVYAQKIQARIGFVTPFDHQHFIAGVDVNFQAYFPVDLTVSHKQDKSIILKFQQVKGEEKAKLLHYSVVPYTAIHDILSLRPLTAEKTTELVYDDEVEPFVIGKNKKIRIDVEGDMSESSIWDMNVDTMSNKLMSPWTMDNGRYSKVEVSTNLDQEQKLGPLVLTLSYDSLVTDSGAKGSDKWIPSVKVAELSALKQGKPQYATKNFLSLVGEGMKSAKAHSLEMVVELLGNIGILNSFTFAWADSDMEAASRTLFHWYMAALKSKEKHYEVCAVSETVTSPRVVPFFDEAILSKPKADFDMAIGYGYNCVGSNINIKGTATQTEQMNNAIKKLLVAYECEDEMQQGNKFLKSCQNAAALAMILDKIELTMETQSKHLQKVIDIVLSSIASSDLVDARINPSEPKNAGRGQIDVNLKLSTDMDTANLNIYTPTMDIRFNDIDMSNFDITTDDVLVAGDSHMDITNLLYNEFNPSCVMDKTKALTFDDKEYPLTLGNCWHVVMTTYPQRSPTWPKMEPYIDPESRVSILTREPHGSNKEVKILLGSDEIIFKPSVGGQPTAQLNGAAVKVSRDTSYQMKGSEGVVFEIYKPEDEFIALTSDVYDVYLIFDGKRFMLQSSDKYRGSVRGLCGNFDGDSTNDFTSPNECLRPNAEQFIASYALVEEQCEGNSPTIRQSLREEDCIKQSRNRYSNVISDFDSGRGNVEHVTWGYHKADQKQETGDKRCSSYGPQVIETDDKICFTTRPVYRCAAGCMAVEKKRKNYQLYCMERTEAAFNLKRRIEKGANPDLSQKPVTMSKLIEVPLACKAA